MPRAAHPSMPQRMSPYPRAGSPRQAGGTWSAQDDATLMNARAQRLSWGPLAQKHFPNKTGNACRKRYERLKEKKSVDDWDDRKSEELAMGYLELRSAIWEPLATRVGEKWQTVEAKCMEKGLKNLEAVGRNGSKKGPTPSSFEADNSTVSPQKESPRGEGDSGVMMDEESSYIENAQPTDRRARLEQPALQGGRRRSFDLPSIASIIDHPPR